MEYVVCQFCKNSGIAMDIHAGPTWRSVKLSVNVDEDDPAMLVVDYKNIKFRMDDPRWDSGIQSTPQ